MSLSQGKNILQEYGDWYMTSDEVYMRMSSSIKAMHWFPHFVSNTLLLQNIAYQTYMHGVVASLHKENKGLWPHFPLSTGVYKIENFKQAKEEVSILSSKLLEITF